MGKKKKSHKKDHKKKSKSRRRSRSSSRSSTSSSDSSRSRSRSSKKDRKKMPPPLTKDPKTAKEAYDEFFNMSNSDASYQLAQKSETLMFDKNKEPDERATDTFIWRKKNKQTGVDKLDPEKMLMLNKLKQEETQRELEKLKKRKVERERENLERDREREFLQRQKETEYHQEWESQEDSFQLKQVKLRSTIRIQEGRAKPIDLLAKYINADDDPKNTSSLDIEMHEPYTYLNGLNIRDLEDLLEDIKVYSDLEMGVNADYWRDISIVCEDELQKLHKQDKNARDHVGDRREGINTSVLADVGTLFKGKSYDQLTQLEEKIKRKIEFEKGIDIGYWESLLAQLKAHMARARLRDRHQEVLYAKLNHLKVKQGIKPSSSSSSSHDKKRDEESTETRKVKRREKEEEAMETKEEEEDMFEKRIRDRIRKEEETYDSKRKDQDKKRGDNNADSDDDMNGLTDRFENEEEEEENRKTTTKLGGKAAVVNAHLNKCMQAYESCDYSPKLLQANDLSFDTFILDPEEDRLRLESRRAEVLGTGALKPSVEDAFEEQARIAILEENEDQQQESSKLKSSEKGLEKEDGSSADGGGVDAATEKGGEGGKKSNTQEISLDHHYLWSDKYRPRKPRYYNRVHTGYDWNQYNKKHYDIDNPPPKTVQGYKFNIFYPDMIDKTKTPRYSITVSKEAKDFSILRFHSGPPYEDVAFKIVNREWDISYRHGFRNHFQNGIYQLWFHFRKWKYRR